MGDSLGRVDTTVMLVDDEENILRALERLFIDEEFSLYTATSGGTALEELSRLENVAVIVSDQRMPSMGGGEFLARAKEIAPDAIRMILTGYADVAAAVDAINLGGAARYIPKPWDDAMLTQAVRDGVDYYLVHMENRRLTAIVQRQNEELAAWNENLKTRVMEQTTIIRRRSEELADQNARMSEAFNGTIQSFSRLVEMASPRMLNHARNVAAISFGIARDLQLSAMEQETIRIAALLHDIGVIGMPDSLLAMRPQEMSPAERLLYQQHAVRGQTAVDAVAELRSAGLLIRHHHEYFNGNGYPDRLSRDDIPFGARIISFADSIDQEMGQRRGEDALEGALRRIKLKLGIALDPSIEESAIGHAKAVYLQGGERYDPEVEDEYPPGRLVPGMRLTRDIYSGTGMLLISKGISLDRQMIESVQRYYEIDPPTVGVYAILDGQRS